MPVSGLGPGYGAAASTMGFGQSNPPTPLTETEEERRKRLLLQQQQMKQGSAANMLLGGSLGAY